jgi:AcrR family transcriptional regulator
MDIAQSIGMKTASIHYHFPCKSDLGVATIQMHIGQFRQMREELANEPPLVQLQWFLNNYSSISADNKVCLVGSLATAFNTLDEPIQTELKIFAAGILEWVTEMLTDGREQGTFHFTTEPRTRAIMIIGNMLAIVQLARLTGEGDVRTVQQTIIDELTHQTI